MLLTKKAFTPTSLHVKKNTFLFAPLPTLKNSPHTSVRVAFAHIARGILNFHKWKPTTLRRGILADTLSRKIVKCCVGIATGGNQGNNFFRGVDKLRLEIVLICGVPIHFFCLQNQKLTLPLQLKNKIELCPKS